MCSVLAVTNSVINALAMDLATTFVRLASGTLISLLRHSIPKQVGIATYIVIIATLMDPQNRDYFKQLDVPVMDFFETFTARLEEGL